VWNACESLNGVLLWCMRGCGLGTTERVSTSTEHITLQALMVRGRTYTHRDIEGGGRQGRSFCLKGSDIYV
jgi:hypothetical protein